MKKKNHNMISLMLDPKFKSFHTISSFVGRDQGVALVQEYDKKSLYSMLPNSCLLNSPASQHFLLSRGQFSKLCTTRWCLIGWTIASKFSLVWLSSNSATKLQINTGNYDWKRCRIIDDLYKYILCLCCAN